MAKSLADINTIVRRVTERQDTNDILFPDSVINQYILDFTQLVAPQDIRIFENYTWWEFTLGTTSPDPYPVDLEDLGFTTIGPTAYCEGFKMDWFQDPANFFARWPETTTYEGSRPQQVLYYNNQLVFRNPPDQDYSVKIAAYKTFLNLETNDLNESYVWRYIAYGASLDLLSDFGETERLKEVSDMFRYYKNRVYQRTNMQYMNERSNPEF